MSMSGSLISYENQGDGRGQSSKSKVTIAPSAGCDAPPSPPVRRSSKSSRLKAHVNCLWSVWYGLCLSLFQAYLTTQCAKRFLGYASLPWPVHPPPRLELNFYLAFLAVSVIALPFFLIAAVFKVGNLANDGFKLGRNLSTCTADPSSSVLSGSSENQGVFRSLWQHGGPTAPFLHLTIALCLLMPKLIMEARLIHSGFLPRDSIWKTDLDFMVIHRDRLIVLNFMTSPPPLSNATFTPTSHTFSPTSPDAEELTSLPIDRGGKDVVVSSFADDSVLGSISPEFVNYALALLVYAVRYPSVFWNTNKWFGTLFSLQLIANGVQSLLSFAGVSVLYKVQVVGVPEALPLLKKSNVLGGSPFLLDGYFTLGLFLLSSVLVLSTSLVLYLYGYGRFNAFLNTERERKVIVLRENKSGGWGYFTHCAALSVLLALVVCHAPLLHDHTIVYRGSLDGAVLACVVAAILHLFLWVLIWLVLTVKQKWVFQLRVTIGRAAVRSARSVKLVTDVDLVSSNKPGDDVTAPLLVVGGGRTYTIGETSLKRAITNAIQKAAIERKARLCQQGSQDTADEDTEIYWLRPKPRSPKCSPSDSDRLNWFNRRLNSSQKHKVTFDDSITRSSATDGGRGRIRNPVESPSGIACEDDGDYATLRMGPAGGKVRTEDNASEENKLLEHVLRDDNVTFARSSDLQPDYEDPSPLLTPEPNDLLLPPPPLPPDSNHSAAVIVHNTILSDKTSTATPKCLRRADSGMPHEDLTPRSGSVSSGSQSGSGGSPPGVQNSESSSGVHSNASSRRATSVDDLTVHQEPRQTPWKSCSLQRNVLPPGSQPIYNFAQNHAEQQHQPPVGKMPAVILENPGENTVVIRRKSLRPLTADLSRPPEIKEDPFGRSTNMRMTSFTDESTGSATLPHFPTQPPPTSVIYPCNTMPLPCPPAAPVVVPVKPVSCNVFPRPHTTLPIHHNGVRLFPSPYGKKLQYPGAMTRFPLHNRDSANFSMASSADSEPRS